MRLELVSTHRPSQSKSPSGHRGASSLLSASFTSASDVTPESSTSASRLGATASRSSSTPLHPILAIKTVQWMAHIRMRINGDSLRFAIISRIETPVIFTTLKFSRTSPVRGITSNASFNNSGRTVADCPHTVSAAGRLLPKIDSMEVLARGSTPSLGSRHW